MQMGAMGHAIELLFDPTTEAAIKGVWAQLETAGVPSLASWTHRRHRPHISLSVAGRIDTSQLQGVRDCLPAVFPRPGVLYLSVVPTLALLRLHEEVHAALRDAMVAPRDGYSVGAWVPHCTLAHDLTRAQLARGIDLLHGQAPVTAHVSDAGLLDTTTGEVLPLAALRSHQ